MQIDAFWKHWKVREDPFVAEEARDDPVFHRLVEADTTHPEFDKIFGHCDRPSAAVVFGEKGSGKTALRVMLERRIQQYNEGRESGRAWVVRYDDLNPVLDRFASGRHGGTGPDEQALEKFRLADHQDAILSLVTTRLVDGLTGQAEIPGVPQKRKQILRAVPAGRRLDLAVLSALYDQPATGSFVGRWSQLRSVLKQGSLPTLDICKWLGGLLALAALGLGAVAWWKGDFQGQEAILLGLCAVGAVLLLGRWATGTARLSRLGRRLRGEIHVVERGPAELRRALEEIGSRRLSMVPLPDPANQDSRYQLTARLLGVLKSFGYGGLIVLVDRVDEPALVNGDPRKMRSLVWPMFNNKFLQQEGVGVKLLLPIELRYLLHREEADFFQRARLDKQHMVDRLEWSGATLYDLCSQRLASCLEEGAEIQGLADLFEDSVGRQDLVDALDQMLQPRDAFKFLYQAIHEHCLSVPQDEPVWKIPRLVLQQVRRDQSQRLQDLQRGLRPA
ncbi:MAG: hypothetical protein OER86_01370 [Phycisphaerae bacterium]|nr:hypothetical protein [Phycisphaerae bacterium]